jgi:dTDP-4-dehydrorhamnose reductase
MSVLVFGAEGQLGQALQSIAPPGLELTYAGRTECDLTDANAVSDYIDRIDPEYIINCAAYTAVDKAEEDVEACYKVNRDAVRHIAECCANRKLIHISTDFVFDGKQRTPYTPEDPTAPLGVYGASKLAGEQAALETLPNQAMIIRTSWVYYTIGENFVKTMLRLMVEKESLSVVRDQRGSPTFAKSLAETIRRIIVQSCFTPGIYHWTDAGDISWWDFAKAIQEEGVSKGLLADTIPIVPIQTSEYPTPAQRPAYSVLDTTKLENLVEQGATPWRDNLNQMFEEFRSNER